MGWTVTVVAVFGSNVRAAGDYISQFYELGKTIKSVPPAERADVWAKVSEAANGAGDQFYADSAQRVATSPCTSRNSRDGLRISTARCQKKPKQRSSPSPALAGEPPKSTRSG